MKQKKNDMIDRAELVEDPTKQYDKLAKIDEEMSQLLNIEKNLNAFINNLEEELATKTNHDPEIRKSDTVDCVKIYFNKIITEIEKTYIQLTSTVREKLYYVIYNIALLFVNYIERFRKYKFST